MVKSKSWMMGAVNVILLVLLVWTFTAVCEDTTGITINCEDVTAHVRDEINLTCKVTYLKKECCVIKYKFINTAADDDPVICKDKFRNDPCKQEKNFSCPYTANKNMTTKFKFFLQTNCGTEASAFNVNITGAVKVDPAGGLDTLTKSEGFVESPKETHGLDKSTIAVIICVLSCFVIVAVALFLWKRRKTSRSQHIGYDTCVCKNNISEHSDRETVLKITPVNVQIEKTVSV